MWKVWQYMPTAHCNNYICTCNTTSTYSAAKHNSKPHLSTYITTQKGQEGVVIVCDCEFWQGLAKVLLHPKWKENKNEVMKVMLRKATKVHVYVQCFSLFFQAWEEFLKFDTTAGYSYHWSVSVKGLKRGNTLRLYRAKHLSLINWTYGDTIL